DCRGARGVDGAGQGRPALGAGADPRPHPAQGRPGARRPRLARRRHRRGPRLRLAHRRARPPALRRARRGRGAAARAAGPAQPPAQARRRRRGAAHRRGLLGGAFGPRPLDAQAAGRPAGRVGGGRLRQRRDGPARAQKNELKPWLKEQWCIPPVASAEFVAAMEDVLEVYHRPYDPRRPLVCLDEASRQLIGETMVPIPAAPGQPLRFDHEYVRTGAHNLFMLSEPLIGWRHVEVTDRRTAKDFACVLRWLVEEVHDDAEKVVLVVDNLNTHKPAALYEAFAPEQARRIAERVEWHYTPKHGSWLNMAEIELSVLQRQALAARIDSQERMAGVIAAWEEDRNERGVGVKWRFTTADARIKLHKL